MVEKEPLVEVENTTESGKIIETMIRINTKHMKPGIPVPFTCLGNRFVIIKKDDGKIIIEKQTLIESVGNKLANILRKIQKES